MKIPKSIRINGKTWKVKRKGEGGYFDFAIYEINVSKNIHPNEAESCFLHEIMEIIACESRVRFNGSSDKYYRFLLTHDDFTKYCDLMFQVLKDNKLSF